MYVMKNGMMEFVSNERKTLTEDKAKSAKLTEAMADYLTWAAFDASGKMRAAFDSETEAYFYVRNRGHMSGGSYVSLAGQGKAFKESITEGSEG